MLKFDKNSKKYETIKKGFEYLKKHIALQRLLNHEKT
jgi:hypothetical protein